MQVKIEVSSFTAIAELNGAELEVLTRVFGKLKAIDERYLNGSYVWVSTDTMIKTELTVKPGMVLLPDDEYKSLKAEQDARDAEIAATNKAAILAAMAAVREEQPDAFKNLLAELKKQSIVYYNEDATASGLEVTVRDIGFSTMGYDGNTLYTIVIDNDGKVTRTKG